MSSSNSTSFFFILITHHLKKFIIFFFNDTATTEIYTLSLHDALPISALRAWPDRPRLIIDESDGAVGDLPRARSEEHTSELQSQSNLVCRLLLEKKKKRDKRTILTISWLNIAICLLITLLHILNITNS